MDSVKQILHTPISQYSINMDAGNEAGQVAAVVVETSPKWHA